MNNRRQFIKTILGFASGMGLLLNPLARGVQVVFAKAKKMILPKGTRMNRLAHQNPADLDTRNLDLTPLEKFGTMGLDDHQVDLNRWQLEIDGHVDRSLRLSYNQILQLPSIERNVLLICPGFFAYHARWKGISVAKLLETAGLDSNVAYVTFSGPDGTGEKSKRFPLADILSDKVFLAYSVNDSVLPKKHGFPLRVVAEDHYGGSWVKYVYKVTAIKP
jgi:DMSO/TMAO reductase YedYZ molybdopterin-dependent catalytic subunit